MRGVIGKDEGAGHDLYYASADEYHLQHDEESGRVSDASADCRNDRRKRTKDFLGNGLNRLTNCIAIIS